MELAVEVNVLYMVLILRGKLLWKLAPRFQKTAGASQCVAELDSLSGVLDQVVCEPKFLWRCQEIVDVGY